MLVQRDLALFRFSRVQQGLQGAEDEEGLESSGISVSAPLGMVGKG